MATPCSELKKLKVQDLRNELEKRGMDTSGLKATLIERLESAMQSEVGTAPVDEAIDREDAKGVEFAADLDSRQEPSAAQDTGHTAAIESEVAIATHGVNATEIDDGSAEPVKVDALGTENGAEKANGEAIQEKDASALDLEKKKKRAERFGLDVSGTEQDKLKLRADKFGLKGASSKEEVAKKVARAERFGLKDTNDVLSPDSETATAEAAKKAARAERFGFKAEAKETAGKTVDPATVAAEAAKKAARAERFGIKAPDVSKNDATDAKTMSKPAPVVSTPEEVEKRKKRAERFGLPIKAGDELEARKKLRAEKFGSLAPAATA